MKEMSKSELEKTCFSGLYKLKESDYFVFRTCQNKWIAIPDEAVSEYIHGEKVYEDNISYFKIIGKLFYMNLHSTANMMLEQLKSREKIISSKEE